MARLLSRAAIVLALTILAACTPGQSVVEFAPAHRPQGVTIHVYTTTDRFAGELLAIRDDGVLLIDGRTVRLVPYALVDWSAADQIKGDILPRHRAPSQQERDRLRWLSRYPYGVPPEALARILAAYGQPEVVVAK